MTDDLKSLRRVMELAHLHGRQQATVYLPSLIELFDQHDAAVSALAAIRGELRQFERGGQRDLLPIRATIDDFTPPWIKTLHTG